MTLGKLSDIMLDDIHLGFNYVLVSVSVSVPDRPILESRLITLAS